MQSVASVLVKLQSVPLQLVLYFLGVGAVHIDLVDCCDYWDLGFKSVIEGFDSLLLPSTAETTRITISVT
jgi:hypothetical protein